MILIAKIISTLDLTIASHLVCLLIDSPPPNVHPDVHSRLLSRLCELGMEMPVSTLSNSVSLLYHYAAIPTIVFSKCPEYFDCTFLITDSLSFRNVLS